MSRRRLVPGRLVVATHNAGKLREVSALLEGRGLDLVSAGTLGLPEPAETAGSFAGNATIKALSAARASGSPALADDSGFSVAALDGAPGVETAEWAALPGGGRDYGAGMAEVARRAGGSEDRQAWFTCALVLGWPDGHAETFLGECRGRWVWPPRGERGFGFDPVFVPERESLTFGEMEPAAKHAVSHRAAAFRLLEPWLPPPATPRRSTGA